MIIAYVVFGLCALRQFGVQASIDVIMEEINIPDVNKEYFDPAGTKGSITEDDDGKTKINNNLTVIKALPERTEGHLKLLGMSMGMYNVPTGIDITMQICEMLDEPIILGPFFAVLGFKKDSCPPGPGFYSQEGYALPTETLPDEFEENKYLAIFEILLDNDPLIRILVNADVQTSADG